MQCEKTGAIAYSDEYGCWFRGDLYQTLGGTWILKTAGGQIYEKFSKIRHITLHQIDAHWSELQPYGVIICSNATYHGYEGVPI